MDYRRFPAKQGRHPLSGFYLTWWICLFTYLSAHAAIGQNVFDGGHGAPGVQTAQETGQSLTVEGQDVVAYIGQSIPLKILIHQTDEVKVESTKLLGLPPGFVLTDSAHSLKPDSDSEILNLTGWNIADLRIEPLDRRTGRFPVSLVLAWKLRHTDLIEVSIADFTVAITDERPAGTRAIPKPVAQDGRPPQEPMRKSEGDASAPKPSVAGLSMLNAEAPSLPAFLPRAEAVRRPQSADAPGSTGPAPAPLPSAMPSRAPAETVSFVERAKVLIGRGDISGARLFLERARARKEPNATLLLGQTWDPDMLRQWNVRGLRPDPERAQALYREAAEQKRADDRLLSATQR